MQAGGVAWRWMRKKGIAEGGGDEGDVDKKCRKSREGTPGKTW